MTLFDPVQVGRYTLPNRIVMAPMTRNRAAEGNVPGPLAAKYYSQRASAGLIVTEASQVSPQGVGYPATPGNHSPEQIAGWRKVTDAVHDAGGRIFLQLWHVGRISHPSLQPNGALPVAPSAIAAEGDAVTYQGMQPFVTPRALETDEIPGIVARFRQGAKNAIEAGFDGVEIHGANGYLIDQFLRDGTNKRKDAYGGSVENRTRFLLEVTEAAVDGAGADRVGVRLSPNGAFNSMSDSDPHKTFSHAARELSRFNLAYLHVIEGGPDDTAPNGRFVTAGDLKPLFRNPVIAAAGFDKAKAEATLARGDADLIAFGSLFLANPDLPERLKRNAPLNAGDRATFYGGGAKGYVDYPSLAETVSA